MTLERSVPLRLHVGHRCVQSMAGLLRPLNLWAGGAKWLGSGSLFRFVQRTYSLHCLPSDSPLFLVLDLYSKMHT